MSTPKPDRYEWGATTDEGDRVVRISWNDGHQEPFVIVLARELVADPWFSLGEFLRDELEYELKLRERRTARMKFDRHCPRVVTVGRNVRYLRLVEHVAILEVLCLRAPSKPAPLPVDEYDLQDLGDLEALLERGIAVCVKVHA